MDTYTQVHERARKDIALMTKLMDEGQFTSAVSVSHDIVEWMSHDSRVYWLRLLAKKGCTNNNQLIAKGFDFNNDGDYLNAIKYATDEQSKEYDAVKQKVILLRALLGKELPKFERSLMAKTNVLELKREMPSELEWREKKLYELWQKVNNTEQEMIEAADNCEILGYEQKTNLEDAANGAEQIKNKTYQMEECTENDFYQYKIELEGLANMSTEATREIRNIRATSPLVKKFNELVNRRNKEVKALDEEIKALEAYNASVSRTLHEIESIEKNCLKAVRKLDEYDFSEAAAFFGDNYKDVLLKINITEEVTFGKAVKIVPEKKVSSDDLELDLDDNDDDLDLDLDFSDDEDELDLDLDLDDDDEEEEEDDDDLLDFLLDD